MKQETKIVKTVCFDFDGVIAKYEGWKGFDVLGEPNLAVIQVINDLRLQGIYVIIWTTRPDTPILREWLKKNNVTYDSINSNSHNPPTTSSKPIYHAFVDDRAICYKGQNSQFLMDQVIAMVHSNHRLDQ